MQIEKSKIKYSKKINELINDEFKDLLNRFLDKKLRTGTKTTQVYKSALQRFIIFTNKANILDINSNDSDKYLSSLEEKNFTYNYKINQFHYLQSFFKFVEKHYKSLRKQYYSPILSAEDYNFSPDKVLSIEEQEEKTNDEYFIIDKKAKKNELKKILNKAYDINYEFFIQIVLLTFCGMRASECVSIRKENVKINDRFLMTGIEENARKSSKNSNGIYFCFPEEVSDLLFDYLMYVDKKYPKSVWLFPSHKNPEKHQTTRFLQHYLEILEKLELGFNIRSHKFRKSLSTYRREINGIKTPTYIMETLSNHAISSLEHKTYSKYPIEERRKDYDRYFPDQYKELLKFISKF